MGHQTEKVIEFCFDFIPDLRPIRLPESWHEGRIGGKGMLGPHPIRCRDAESWKKAHNIVLHNSSLKDRMRAHNIDIFIYLSSSLTKKTSEKRDHLDIKDHMRALQEKIVGFLLHEVIDNTGEFSYIHKF